MISTVIFDMDGLLLDTEPLWGESMYWIAQKHGIPVLPHQFKETTGLKILEVVQYWERKYPWEGLGAEIVADEIVTDIIARSKASARVMPGALSLLNLLKKEAFKIGLATSSPTRMLTELLDFFELTSYFDVLTSADEVDFGKPHPAVFLRCAQKLNSHVLETLVLEDSFNGVIAAKAARMKVYAVPDITHRADIRFNAADKILDSLEQIDLELLS